MKAACCGPITICYMVNHRFIQLLTKELCEELTDTEREELTVFLRENEYSHQRELLKEYWERDKTAYEANTSMFKKVLEKIKTAESSRPEERLTPESSGPVPLEAAEHLALPEDPQYPGNTSGQEYPDYPLPRRKWAPRVWAAAAAVLLVIIGSTWYSRSPGPGLNNTTVALHWQQATTQPTKKTVLTLSDGTVVTLNSATTIRYPDHFNDSTREVYLEGEAYFDVNKDPSHPFIIHADKMNIRVLGTSFNVKSYRNESLSEATLIKGSIEVTLNDRPSDRIILKPKEKLIVQNNIAIRQPVAPDPAAQDSTGKSTRYALTNLTYFPNNVKTVIETSWVENKLVFTDKDFAQLSGQLERWYGVHIQFGNERVKQYSFTGFFEKESLPEALDALKLIENFNYKIADSTVYIY
jgi:ferric-dicitrate binding protein FerR (iron transport regulator)